MDAVIGRRTPLMQVVLKRDEGIWKYHYSKSELTDEQLREMIKRNPPDPDAIYLPPPSPASRAEQPYSLLSSR